MTYWQDVEAAAGWGHRYLWVVLGALIAAFILGSVAPDARKRLRATTLLIALSFTGMLICALIVHAAFLQSTATGYRYLHFGSQLLMSVAVINLTAVLIFRVLLRPVGLEPAPILRDTLLGVSVIIVALTLLARHGVDLSGIVATSAVVTAVIGFSLQDTLGNVMGGVALQMERSIEVQDWIRLGDLEGIVREIRWRQTSIETRNGDTVVIPNSVLMKSQVTVLGRRQGKPKLHRMMVEFNVDFRHTPQQVVDAVLRALHGDPIPNVATDPLPDCAFIDFKESYGRYAVRYWLIDFAKDTPTSSEVRMRIFVALRRADITPSIPAQSVFMTMESRTRSERKQKEEQEHRAGALKAVKLLEALTDEERRDLAAKLTVAPFRQGEVITRQGNEAHFLYVLTEGEVEVRIAGPEGVSRAVARLKACDVFGEMGMLTGEPRTASVAAVTDVTCYRLDKAAFQETVQRRPEIAEAMSHLLARRKMELHATATDDNRSDLMAHTQRDLLHRIRKFFTLIS